MNDKRPDFRDSLAALMAEAESQAAGHPDAAQWLAYHRGELPPETEESLQEHLVGCRECGDLLLAAGAFDTDSLDTEPGAARVGREPHHPGGEEWRAAAAWRLLAPVLDGNASALPGFDRGPNLPTRPRWIWAIAASWLAVLVGLGAWNLAEHRQVAELARPRALAHFVYLAPRERAEPELATAPAGEPLVLVLYPEAAAEAAPETLYQVAIVERSDPRERPVETLERLPPDEDGALAVLLPTGLPAGQYRIVLSATSPGEAGNDLRRYDLEITAGRGTAAAETP